MRDTSTGGIQIAIEVYLHLVSGQNSRGKKLSENPIHTIAVHAGAEPEKYSGALSVPVYNSTVFAFEDAEQAAAINAGEQHGYAYGRKGNPT